MKQSILLELTLAQGVRQIPLERIKGFATALGAKPGDVRSARASDFTIPKDGIMLLGVSEILEVEEVLDEIGKSSISYSGQVRSAGVLPTNVLRVVTSDGTFDYNIFEVMRALNWISSCTWGMGKDGVYRLYIFAEVSRSMIASRYTSPTIVRTYIRK